MLLQKGAAQVYVVDVGHGQLAWKLRQDPRVVVLERLNARYLTAAQIARAARIVVCDASFIGLETVLPAALGFAAPQARLVALIKPQFEVGPRRVGKGGVVRDPALHQEVCRANRRLVTVLAGTWSASSKARSGALRGMSNSWSMPGAVDGGRAEE